MKGKVSRITLSHPYTAAIEKYLLDAGENRRCMEIALACFPDRPTPGSYVVQYSAPLLRSGRVVRRSWGNYCHAEHMGKPWRERCPTCGQSRRACA